MNRWWLWISTLVLAFGVACGDDGDHNGGSGSGGGGGQGGSAGASSGTAGKGGTGQGGGAGTAGSSGMAGQGGQVSCEPPPPPSGEDSGGEGGGAGDGAGGLSPLAIAGNYEDEFGGSYTITSSQWQNPPAVYHIAAYDNDQRWIVARNDENNDYGPCLWSRYDWVVTEDGLFYCTTEFDAETEQEARDAAPPDPAAPNEGGCNMFPWSRLIPR
jgi:hypothetical protein